MDYIRFGLVDVVLKPNTRNAVSRELILTFRNVLVHKDRCMSPLKIINFIHNLPKMYINNNI